jgi:glyoxylase-like metal-dependent hydrolase (beta-lactamase superfamily II)
VIKEIKYSTTNTYLIKGAYGTLLFDTGWAGTLSAFCHAVGEAGEKVQDIDCIMISHFHPDHMGIAQEIADMGPVICVADEQKDYVHSSDGILARDNRAFFIPVKDENIRVFTIGESRALLNELGIDGAVYATPGHSDDSISLLLDSGELFVGDLNPLYELELHRGTQIEKSWNMLLSMHPRKVFYGHAPSADL